MRERKAVCPSPVQIEATPPHSPQFLLPQPHKISLIPTPPSTTTTHPFSPTLHIALHPKPVPCPAHSKSDERCSRAGSLEPRGLSGLGSEEEVVGC